MNLPPLTDAKPKRSGVRIPEHLFTFRSHLTRCEALPSKTFQRSSAQIQIDSINLLKAWEPTLMLESCNNKEKYIDVMRVRFFSENELNIRTVRFVYFSRREQQSLKGLPLRKWPTATEGGEGDRGDEPFVLTQRCEPI